MASHTITTRTFYRDGGFDTEVRTWGGAPHCLHPIGGPTIDWFESH